MVRELVAQMLGGYGNALLVFITSNPALLALVLVAWFGVIFAGNLQLRRVERETVRLVVHESARLMAANPTITARQLHEALYPVWVAELRRWAWYVPHRWELWPVPAQPETVQRHFEFTPKWLRQVLSERREHEQKGLNGHNIASG
jgi:hypothetical protein